MRSTELVSVIVPVYNAISYLDTCVGGIVSQSYPELEILLVDDGSTDSSGVLCDKWAEKDSRIRVIHKANGGQSTARNAGLDVCKGNYVVFVDADDCIHRELIAYLHQLMLELEADLSVCEYRYLTGNGNVLNQFQDNGQTVSFSQEEALRELCNDTLFSSSPWAKMFKKEAFQNLRFPEGHIFEDLGTIYKLFLKADRVAFGQRALYDYMYRPNSTVNSVFQPRRLDSVFYAEQMCREIVSHWPSLNDVAQRRLFIEYAYCLRTITLSGSWTPDIQRTFRDFYLKLRCTTKTAWQTRLTVKQRCYAVCAWLGEPVLRAGFVVEDTIFNLVRLKRFPKR